MLGSTVIRLISLLSALAMPAVVRAADPPAGAAGPSAQTRTVRRTFVARGPSTEADLARLRAAIEMLPGVVKVETHAEADGATVSIDGDQISSQSVVAAAARNAGFVLRPAPTRSYVASGPNGEADLVRLREALNKTPGVEQVEVGRRADGGALRVTGVARAATLLAAGKAAGFTLRPLASYVVAGPSAAPELARLQAALARVAGVEQLELQALAGGATLLLYGEAKEDALEAAARRAGYAVWPLGAASAPREFRIEGRVTADDHDRLRDALRTVEGIGKIEVRSTPEGPRLIVDGGRARPQRIVAAAAGAGLTLVPVETVDLPSGVPEAGRNTPPDYGERVLEDQAKPGALAPDFTLLAPDGKQTIRLSDYRGKKPVVLAFGSCT